MDNPNTFFNYYGRFFQKFWEGFVEWPRDNFLVAGIAAIAPPLALYLQHPDKVPDWELIKTTSLVYLALLGVYTILHLVLVPWKIDREQSFAISKMEAEKAELPQQRKEFDEAKPNIILREPSARLIEVISLNDGRVVTLTAAFVKVRFVNRPTKHTPTAIAQGVSAKIKFFDKDGQLVLEMDGRWDDKDQPTLRLATQSKRDLLLTDFAIEEERNLDIAFLDPKSNQFIAMNNDNYKCQDSRLPEHFLKGDQFRAEIRLIAVHVDVTFSVEFAASGLRGNVKILGENIEYVV